MLLSLLIGFASLPSVPQAVHLSGYYSLKDLALALTTPSIKISVAHDCEQDTFAVQCSHSNTTDLVKALEATDRVLAKRTPSGWTLSRAVDFASKSRILNDYIRQSLLPAMQDRAAALPIAKRMWSESREQRDLEFGELNRMVERKELSYDVVQAVDEAMQAENLFPMTVLTELSTRPRFGVGELRIFRIADRPDLFFPDANHIASWLRTEGPYGPPLENAGVKLALDPVSGGMTLRMVYGRSAGPYGLVQPKPLALLRNPTFGPPPPETVLTSDELRAFRKRFADTSYVLTDATCTRSVQIPTSNYRISDLLLKVAQGSDTDFVSYVSPLSDRRLGAAPAYSVGSIISRANDGRYDRISDSRSATERLGYVGSTSSRTPWWSAFSLSKSGSVLAVRTENDFLDALVEGPRIPTFALSDGKPILAWPSLAPPLQKTLPP